MAYKITLKIIVEDLGMDQQEICIKGECNEEKWEEDSYHIGCAVAREIAKRVLESIDQRILEKRPKTLKVHDSSKRTRVTRFGKIPVWRRLYEDQEGRYHYLLDEYLNWQPYKVSTPSLRESLVEMSTEKSFEKVSRTLEKLTAGVLSRSTIHRMLQEVTEAAMGDERQIWESCFHAGKLLKPGERKTPVLYTEADGLRVHLQREGDQRYYELKSAIAYEGWERLSQKEERYRLLHKKVYCHSDPSIPFWEGASLQWDRHWDMSCLEMIVLGGDDANWINKGLEELPYCVRQLDGFHLSRSCRRGWEDGDNMYTAIRSGRVRNTLGVLKEREGKAAQKERSHVLKCLERGADWRNQISGTPFSFLVSGEVRGLGAMESNEDKLFADRMKKRGLSWTIAGAQHMGKAIQLVANGELGNWCGRKPPDVREWEDRPSFDLFDPRDEYAAPIPALTGPHAARPWVKVLRHLTKYEYPII